MAVDAGTTSIEPRHEPTRRETHDRVAFGVFVGLEAVAGVGALVLGRRIWFQLDEWDFLVSRRAGSVNDLLMGHNGHWVTLPLLAYRSLWTVFGIRSYVPYLCLIVAAHLLTALLVRAVMVRALVRAWTATVIAGAFVFFGSGYQNILSGFQITMVGSLVFGLAQLLLADHDGPVDRRDWLGIVAGLAALMCSTVGVAMVMAVGIATFLRRGWRVAVLHTVPLGAIFTAWWVHYGRTNSSLDTRATDDVRFVGRNVVHSLGDLGKVRGIGVAIVAVFVVGAVLVAARRSDELRSTLAAPLALVAASAMLLGVTAIGRADLSTSVQPRYEYMFVALTLPAFAVCCETIARRHRSLLAGLVALVLVGVPGNVLALVHYVDSPAVASAMPAYRRMITTTAHLPLATTVPRSLRIEMTTGFRITVGWLLAGAASGRIPKPATTSEAEVAVDTIRLSVQEQGGPLPGRVCIPARRDVAVSLASGQSIGIERDMAHIRLEPVDGIVANTYPIRFGHPFFGNRLAAVHPAAFRVTAPADSPALVCGNADVMGRSRALRAGR